MHTDRASDDNNILQRYDYSKAIDHGRQALPTMVPVVSLLLIS